MRPAAPDGQRPQLASAPAPDGARRLPAPTSASTNGTAPKLVAQAALGHVVRPGLADAKAPGRVEKLVEIDEVLEWIVVLAEPLRLVDILGLEQRRHQKTGCQAEPEDTGGGRRKKPDAASAAPLRSKASTTR